MQMQHSGGDNYEQKASQHAPRKPTKPTTAQPKHTKQLANTQR
jgi:hypothetical protein